jgi:hypothetical protein
VFKENKGGSKVNDTSLLLQGDYKDGRRTVVFSDPADVEAKEKLQQQIIKKWLALMDEK